MRVRRWLAGRVYYGWVIAIACLLAVMAVFGTTYAFGVFYDAFVDEFAVSRTALAATFGLQTALIYVGAVAAGRAVDRIGGRRVTAASGALLVAGLTWTAFARSFPELVVAFGVVAAFGMAGLYVVGYATVPVWFERRRGAAAGLAAAGLGVGLVVVPPGADHLIGVVGWRGAMLAVAGGAAVLTVLTVALLVDDPAAVGADRSVEFGDVDRGARRDGGNADAADADPVDDDAANADPVDDDSGTEAANGRSARAIALSAPFLLAFCGWVFLFAPMYAVMTHVVVHAGESGIGRSAGVLAITVIGATTTGARLGIGPIADRIGRTRTFAACGAVMGVSVVAFAGAPTAATLLAVAVVFGVGYGGCGGLFGAVVADLFGDTHLNTLFGLMSLSFAVSGLLAPPLAGYLFEVTGDYAVAFVGLGLLGVVGSGCIAVSARLVSGSNAGE
ncbi:MFS transporter [Halorubrum sp. JWXQ-INN 858]|uniref:MFS transporter n=1 Tax=Halorubrum sp. JWXQ-INN 858 TaxID=2690782 RepID=UPI001359B4BD|nr:MFS transporter [Halorubrum sp. JWXQ-INN 858]MWV64327.1 MFS transporter [Halorubrum sp. JWXQ-INN 858]